MPAEDRFHRMRQALVRLVIGVVLVDLAGFGIWHLAGGQEGDPAKLQWIIGVWLLAVLAVIVPNLRAIRRIRREP